ncbi:hypothetical protein RAJCM14343_1145 [Rhodococcus aetherivorans]|uniref:Uncharacterized protein n=1 Tax=Rhodococcus aetherivorans TaxID=191292 RepID=A0ABQ0YHB5_9NOCA|nr:hypothetical protein RAJCM14343_1145 [Rhodococcus aetherivorans]
MRPSRPGTVEFGALSPSEAALSELSASSVRVTSRRTVEADQLGDRRRGLAPVNDLR